MSPDAVRELLKRKDYDSQRWAAHEATARELAKIEVQLVELNYNIKELLLIIKEVTKIG